MPALLRGLLSRNPQPWCSRRENQSPACSCVSFEKLTAVSPHDLRVGLYLEIRVFGEEMKVEVMTTICVFWPQNVNTGTHGLRDGPRHLSSSVGEEDGDPAVSCNQELRISTVVSRADYATPMKPLRGVVPYSRCSEGHLPADPTEPVFDDPGHPPPQDHVSYGIHWSLPTKATVQSLREACEAVAGFEHGDGHANKRGKQLPSANNQAQDDPHQVLVRPQTPVGLRLRNPEQARQTGRLSDARWRPSPVDCRAVPLVPTQHAAEAFSPLSPGQQKAPQTSASIPSRQNPSRLRVTGLDSAVCAGAFLPLLRGTSTSFQG
ncbi:unnamed protein product [Rangifer tarandus platyrhynchus]|uniref:Uncharacterized protein n=1 Tax=Rangifer tarandus platyrhynchus TaxID=3082113 RepID=A0ACB1KHJ8_RANTA